MSVRTMEQPNAAKIPKQPARLRGSSLRTAFSVLAYLLFAAFAIAYILPLIITITNSFMRQQDIVGHLVGETIQMPIFPANGTLLQYRQVLIESPVYLNMFWNSVAITAAVVAGALLVSSFGAYAFTVLQFRFKEVLFFAYVIVMLLPLQVTLMPNYIVANALGLQDNWLAIILPGIFSPFGVFILRQQMKLLPSEYIEAAQVDGAGHMRIFLQIMLPLVKSGIAALGILTFIEYWNLIDQAVVFIKDFDKQPMSLFLAQINTRHLGLSFAASVFYVIPALIVMLYGGDSLRDGIRMSSVKS